MNLDARTIRLSRERLVVSGNTYEWYEYARPYVYNLPALRQSAASSLRSSAMHNEDGRRADNLSVARRALRRLILANEGRHPERLKFFTYTFAENVADYDEAMTYWRHFARRLREKFDSPKYVGVVEFQKRGAVHFHVLHFNMPYRRGLKTEIASLWGYGFVKLITLSKIRHVSLYVSKYLRKAKVDGRLTSKKAYFCSRGLERPFQIRNPAAIAEFCAGARMLEEGTRIVQSLRFGSINYKIGKIAL